MNSIFLLAALRSAAKTTFLAFFIFYLIFLSGGVSLIVNALLLGTAAGVWMITRKTQTGIETWGLIFAAVLLLTSLLAYDPRRSVDQAWKICAGLLILFLTPGWVRVAGSPRRFLGILLAVGGVGMAWFWLGAAQWYQSWLQAEPGQWLPGISFRLAGSNNTAAYLNILLMAGLAFLSFSPNRWQRLVWAVYNLSAVILLFLTSSRGGWVAAAAGLGVFGLLIWLRSKEDLALLGQRLRGRWTFWALVTVGVLAAGAFAFLYLTQMGHHPTHGRAIDSRNVFWAVGWKGFLQSPLWGNGLNVYASFYLRDHSSPPSEIFLHSHNQYIDILFGAGLTGALAFGCLLHHLIKELKLGWQAMQPGQALPALAAAAALTTYLVHGIFDGLYRMPFASLSLVMVLGAALYPGKPAGKLNRGLISAFGAAVVAFAIFNAWRTAPLQAGVEAAEVGQLQIAAQQIKAAVQRDPRLAVAHQQAGIIHSLLAAEGQPGALDQAISYFEQAVFLDPDWGLNHANLGALYRTRGDLQAARDSLTRAVDCAPQTAVFWLNLGQVEEDLGHLEAAGLAYQEALHLQPEWQSANFWRETAFRAEVVEIYSIPPAPTISIEDLYQTIASGRARAEDFIELARIQTENNQLADARRSLEKARLAYFSKSIIRVELNWQAAEIAAAEGEYQQAAAFAESALDGFRNQNIYGPGYSPVTHYVRDVFAMPGMSRDIVPQLTLITLHDPWGERMLHLSQWYAQLGQTEQARATQIELNTYLPDFIP